MKVKELCVWVPYLGNASRSELWPRSSAACEHGVLVVKNEQGLGVKMYAEGQWLTAELVFEEEGDDAQE